MKRLVILAVFGAIVIGAGCKRASDQLAVYSSGMITRGEFYEWIDAKHFVRDSILKSKRNQKSKLEMMAVDRFAVEEAKKSGFDASEEFKVYSDMATDAQLMDILYTREIKEKIRFNEPAVRVRHILVRIKDYKIERNKRVSLSPVEVEGETSAAVNEARGIIEKLNKGEKFEKLAKLHSDEFSRKSGGDIGYIVADMMPPDYSRKAFELGEGEYTREPVRVGNGVYVIQVIERKNLTDKNIERIIEDKMQAARLRNRFYNKASREYLQRLMAAGDVESHLERAVSRNKNEVIFRVGGTVFTVGDLDKKIGIYMGRVSQGHAAPAVTGDQRKSLAENFFKFELLKREAMRKGLDKDPEYARRVTIKRDSILAREYMKKIGSSVGSATEAEMRDEYELNKDKRYYAMVTRGNSKIRVPEPYWKMRERIKRIIESKKQFEAVRRWKEEILKARNFKVMEKELEGE